MSTITAPTDLAGTDDVFLSVRDWGTVRCWEVSPFATAGDVHGSLVEALDEPPTLQQVDNLLTPDDRPHVDPPVPGQRIRRTSAFDVRAHVLGMTDCMGLVTFRMVEFLTGPDWIVVCWHTPVSYCGAREVPEFYETQPAETIWSAVERRCDGCSGHTSGDLGVLLLHELALTYAPAAREITDWFEQWEVKTHSAGTVADAPACPEEIWGSIVRFRSWLGPLNPAGLQTDLEKAWFADVSSKGDVVDVDERIGRTLNQLAELARELRYAFASVHDARQRRRSDRLEQFGVLALVPTFIASFYGANTRLPGGATWGGFEIMVGAMVVLTAIALLALLAIQRERRGRHAVTHTR